MSVDKRLDTLTMLRTLAMRQSPRAAIKMQGRIIFINFGDVVAVQRIGKKKIYFKGTAGLRRRRWPGGLADSREWRSGQLTGNCVC